MDTTDTYVSPMKMVHGGSSGGGDMFSFQSRDDERGRRDNVAKCSNQRLHYARKNGKTTRLTDEGVTTDKRQETIALRANLLS